MNYKEILKDLSNFKNLSINNKILLVDGLNNFIRSWITNSTTTDNGNHIGGIVGFLKSLAYSIRIINPTRVIIIFDGQDASKNKRKIYSEYKLNRGYGSRLRRNYEYDENEEKEQMVIQLARLIKYLQYLPVSIIIIPHLEADDAIGYISTELCNNKEDIKEIYIMSTDKDFYQLINEKTFVWNPIKKEKIDETKFLELYNIYPFNFILFRAMEGDFSDNIKGIKGIGLKTALKSFPFLSNNEKYDINYIINYAEQHKDNNRICKLLFENKEQYLLNYNLMNISIGNIKKSFALDIIEIFNKVPKMNLNMIKNMIIEDRLWNGFNFTNENFHFNSTDIISWLYNNFSKLNYFANK